MSLKHFQQEISRIKTHPTQSLEALLQEEDDNDDDLEELAAAEAQSPSTARLKLEQLLAEESDEERESLGGAYEVVDKHDALGHSSSFAQLQPPRASERAAHVSVAAKKKAQMAVSALVSKVNSLRTARATAAHEQEDGDFSDDGDVEESQCTPAPTSAPRIAVPQHDDTAQLPTEAAKPQPPQGAQERKVVVVKKKMVIKPKEKKVEKKPAKRRPVPPKSTGLSRTDEEIAHLERKLELLKAHAGLNDDELDWKLAATAAEDPYGLAVERREECEGEYDRLMWQQSKLETLVRICDDRRVTDALTALAKVCREKPAPEAAAKKPAPEEAPKPQPVARQAGDDEKPKSGPQGRAALAGALGAALANRGRGGGRGGGLGGGRGLPPAGGLMAAIAARGRGGRGIAGAGVVVSHKSKKTLASCRSSLETARQRSRQDVSRLPKLEDFEVVDKIVARVLDVCSEERKEECAKACDAALVELRRVVDDSKAELEDVSKTLLETEDDLERWRKREADAPNRAAALAKQEHEWAQREAVENAVALAVARTLVPPDVANETADSLRIKAAMRISEAVDKAKSGNSQNADEASSSTKRALTLAAKWGGLYTYELAQRIKQCKPLHWVQAHPDDLATANFLAGAGADTFKNLADYDIMELRAIYASCPSKFELDASGAKAAWRANLVERLRELTARERGETIAAGWDGVNNRRNVTKLPPLDPKQQRNAAYYYPSTAELEARTKKHNEARTRVETRRERVAELERQLADAKAERDAAFVDARSEYLQQRYGKAMLKQLAKEADEQYRKIVADLGSDASVTGARADLRRAAAAVANAHPSQADHAALRKLLERNELDKVNTEKDAADLASLRERVSEKLGIDVPIKPAPAVPNVGRLIRGPFYPWPQITRAERTAVVKKLSEAEEAEMRKLEIAAATKAAASSDNGLARRAIHAWGQPAQAPAGAGNSTKELQRSASSRSFAATAATSDAKVLEPVQPKSKRLSQLLAAREQRANEDARASQQQSEETSERRIEDDARS